MSQAEVGSAVQPEGVSSAIPSKYYGPAIVVWVTAGLIALVQVTILLSRVAGGRSAAAVELPAAAVLASAYSLWVPVVLAALGVFMNDQHRVLRDLADRSATLGE